jgi:hypothetical protein
MSMSTPLPSPSDETAGQASALQPVKSTGDPSHVDYSDSDSSDFPEGGVTAWGTALGA